MAWALDLGTSNTGLARWDPEAHRPRLMLLPDVCRKPSGEDHLEAPRLVPSATEIVSEDHLGFWARMGRRPFWLRRNFWGQHAIIGRSALERSETERLPGFVPSFKTALQRAPLRTLAQRDGRQLSARDVGQLFLRELMRSVKLHTGERIRELTITAPVDSYETYRAELSGICRRLGIGKVHFLDEPVAAAMGYGVSLKDRRRVLVCDFGAGTLDLAIVDLSPRGMEEGRCEVIAKAGRLDGGNRVDEWLLDDFCQALEYRLDPGAGGDQAFWHRLMLGEARRVKEAVFFSPSETFAVTPPEEIALFEARMRGKADALRFDRARLIHILEQRGLYLSVEACLDECLKQSMDAGVGVDDIDEVLMVGGSTLLPDVYLRFEERFGRDRVRAWQPFEAVAYGACAYAAEAFEQSDFIVHDYAFLTYDAETHEPEYEVIIPKGTRIPTKHDFWKKRLVPTCSLGEPERVFKLVVSEIGRPDAEGDRAFAWDKAGQLHKVGGSGGTEVLVVHLNESEPTLGSLDPPHSPRDRKARLEIAFGVNSERWLTAHVVDLKTNKVLMRDEPVVRLL